LFFECVIHSFVFVDFEIIFLSVVVVVVSVGVFCICFRFLKRRIGMFDLTSHTEAHTLSVV
ncbi:hypothetical protein L6232_27000, partial [Shewanella sp. C31]|nr:hypothetical protein [Shewanella electrica]